ncbi:MAG: ATP-dependent helicase [Saprospirales bacterium]|nr:ATP-dependent helicase [Saprospirales bacterium]
MEPRTYNERFLREIDKLNDAQRKAVDLIDGPVLVIAGPGTGKTHILAARIGRILLETDTQAPNILCLTFTDAGVRAMRKRLLEWIGPEAHRVHIYTFHSFCNTIIQDNLELFGHQDLEPITELERIELIRELIEELPADHLLKSQIANPFHYEQQLSDLFQRIKGENWSAEYVQEMIGQYVQDLPNREKYIYKRNTRTHQKGDLKEVDYQAEVERMKRLQAGVQLYPNFQARMREGRRYDYDDMILWVLDAFEKYPFLLRQYQERYLYFLVDEYQDTNGAQHAVLQHLLEFWDSPNIFIVGDDDQSIYEFQGARLKNLVDFYQAYPEVEVIVLEENYRSAQGILDAAHFLVERNENRIINVLNGLGLEKRLIAAHEDMVGLKVKPVLASYPNPMHELADLILQIETLRDAGVPLEEIAFIYPQHRQGEWLRNLLGKRGIPYQVKRKVNILDLTLIRQIRRLLEYFYAEEREPYSGEAMLFPLLHDGYWGISPEGLASLSKRQRQETAEGKLARIPWRDLLRDPQAIADCGETDRAAIERCTLLMDDFFQRIPNWPLPATLEALFTRAGILNYILNHAERDTLLQAAYTLMAFAREETIRNPRLTVEGFLMTLRKMDANGLSLELRQPATIEKGVNLLTAHSAKGLEFDYVFLLDTVANYWEPRSNHGSYRFSFPDTLTFSGEEDALEARRRLFYVSITRARKGLHISFSRTNEQGKEQAHAQFVDELIESGLVPEEKQAPAELVLKMEELLLRETREKPAIPPMDHEEVEARLEGFQLSVSALNTYLRCSLSFFYEYILQVPQLESVHGLYGTAVHRALQTYFNRMRASTESYFLTSCARCLV